MRSGLLREPIEIYRTAIVSDEYGSTTEEYTLLSRTRARVIHDSGNRQNSNDEIIFLYYKTFEVWMYVDIQENTDYILWNGRKYRVLSIEPVKEQNKKIIETQLINE